MDHIAANRQIKRRTGAKICIHRADSEMLIDARKNFSDLMAVPVTSPPADRLLEGEDVIRLGELELKVIHTPGHSPGSMVYLTESEGLKVLFGQDVHGPLDSSLLSNREDYLRSLNLLLSLNADILCEGHFGIFKGKEKVANFIRSFM